MKRLIIAFIISVAFIGGFIAGQTVPKVQADPAADPGSQNDPLVSQSYVNRMVDSKTTELQNKINELQTKAEALQQKLNGLEKTAQN